MTSLDMLSQAFQAVYLSTTSSDVLQHLDTSGLRKAKAAAAAKGKGVKPTGNSAAKCCEQTEQTTFFVSETQQACQILSACFELKQL